MARVHEEMRLRQRIRRDREEERLDIIDKYQANKEQFNVQQSKALGEFT